MIPPMALPLLQQLAMLIKPVLAMCISMALRGPFVNLVKVATGVHGAKVGFCSLQASVPVIVERCEVGMALDGLANIVNLLRFIFSF